MVAYTSNEGGIFISSYSKGDTKWNTLSTPTPSHQHFFYCSRVTYMKRMFYCFGGEGALSSFNFTTHEWSREGKPWDWTLSRTRPYAEAHFLAYKGDLYLIEEEIDAYILYRSDRRIYMPCCCNYIVYKFDWLDKTWKRMETLESGTTIFVHRDRGFSWCAFGRSAKEVGEGTEQTKIPAFQFGVHSEISTVAWD